jgi:histidinol phosphatase-like PHP family hydrolase
MEDIERLGISYTVAAAHSAWHTDVTKKEAFIAERHRHHMYIAIDPRVDILGHPWWFDKIDVAPYYTDFDLIPVSMHDELASALKENGVCIEANADMLYGNNYPEQFYRKYCEYLRYMFEKGVKMTFGSDCHGPEYKDHREGVQKALGVVGFKSRDFSIPRFRR